MTSDVATVKTSPFAIPIPRLSLLPACEPSSADDHRAYPHAPYTGLSTSAGVRALRARRHARMAVAAPAAARQRRSPQVRLARASLPSHLTLTRTCARTHARVNTRTSVRVRARAHALTHSRTCAHSNESTYLVSQTNSAGMRTQSRPLTCSFGWLHASGLLGETLWQKTRPHVHAAMPAASVPAAGDPERGSCNAGINVSSLAPRKPFFDCYCGTQH
eukprot:6205114-Pleurochrysis_carterae.AAC.1